MYFCAEFAKTDTTRVKTRVQINIIINKMKVRASRVKARFCNSMTPKLQNLNSFKL